MWIFGDNSFIQKLSFLFGDLSFFRPDPEFFLHLTWVFFGSRPEFFRRKSICPFFLNFSGFLLFFIPKFFAIFITNKLHVDGVLLSWFLWKRCFLGYYIRPGIWGARNIQNLSFRRKTLSFFENLSFFGTWVFSKMHKKKAWLPTVCCNKICA